MRKIDYVLFPLMAYGWLLFMFIMVTLGILLYPLKFVFGEVKHGEEQYKIFKDNIKKGFAK